jgi:hypothetical protein
VCGGSGGIWTWHGPTYLPSTTHPTTPLAPWGSPPTSCHQPLTTPPELLIIGPVLSVHRANAVYAERVMEGCQVSLNPPPIHVVGTSLHPRAPADFLGFKCNCGLLLYCPSNGRRVLIAAHYDVLYRYHTRSRPVFNWTTCLSLAASNAPSDALPYLTGVQGSRQIEVWCGGSDKFFRILPLIAPLTAWAVCLPPHFARLSAKICCVCSERKLMH